MDYEGGDHIGMLLDYGTDDKDNIISPMHFLVKSFWICTAHMFQY